MTNKVFVTWKQVEDFVEHVATILEEREIKLSGVYGIPKGGLVFAVMIAHRLNIPMLMSPSEGCLIVDDICDSGESLLHYIRNTSNPNGPKYYTATMFYKENKLGIVPDMFSRMKGDDWIVFPFEYDTDRPKEGN